MALDKPHLFASHNYKKPTFCAHCSGLLVGIVKQGLRCKRCRLDIHEKCLEPLEKSCVEIIAGHHNFSVKNYHHPTYCDYCSKLLVGVVHQGLRCSECGANVHERCEDLIEPMCGKTKRRRRSFNVINPPEDLTQPTHSESHDELRNSPSRIQRTQTSRTSMKRRATDPHKQQLKTKQLQGKDRRGEDADDENTDDENPQRQVSFEKMPNKKSPLKQQKTSEMMTTKATAQTISSSLNSSEKSPTTYTQTLTSEVESVIGIMANNAKKIQERHEKLDDLQVNARKLEETSGLFQKTSNQINKKYWLKSKKMMIGLTAAGLILVVIIIIAVVFAARK